MAVHVLDAMAREGFEEVIALHDRDSGLRGFLGIHDSSAGPAFGGLRRLAYRDETSALLDCLRLSKAMSYKCAMIGVAGGGAKLVLLDGRDVDRRGAYRHVGRCIERLQGRVYVGPDVGTGWRELGWVAEETAYVTRPGAEGPGDLGEATAAGVLAGMGAALVHLDGAEDWARRTVVIQGLGNAGGWLARRLVELGVRVLASELDVDRRARHERDYGVVPIEPGAELDQDCDVFSPCALGGILHDLSIQRLRARVVCGAANNVLARTLHGVALHEKGVLYVPDFVVGAGGLLRGAEFHLLGRSPSLAEIERRVAASVADLLAIAAAEGEPTSRVAWKEAQRRLVARRNAPGEEEEVHGPLPGTVSVPVSGPVPVHPA